MATRPTNSQSPVDAVFIGVATFDAIALVDGFPAPDDRVVASEVAYAGGGPAATAAVAASRLGVRTAFVGTVGDDANGRAILAGLADEGVDVSGVTVLAGHASAASVVIVDRVRDSRAICNRPAPRIDITAGTAPHRVESRRPRRPRGLGSGLRLRAPARGPAALRGCRQPHPGLHAPRRRPLRADRRGAPPHLRPGTAGRRPPGPGRCRGLRRRRRHRRGARLLRAHRRRGDGLRAGAHGPILSTLGAGDVFHGALVAAVVKGMPLDQQLAFANVTAALSCRGLDGRSRIPSLAEVEAAMPANAH